MKGWVQLAVLLLWQLIGVHAVEMKIVRRCVASSQGTHTE